MLEELLSNDKPSHDNNTYCKKRVLVHIKIMEELYSNDKPFKDANTECKKRVVVHSMLGHQAVAHSLSWTNHRGQANKKVATTKLWTPEEANAQLKKLISMGNKKRGETTNPFISDETEYHQYADEDRQLSPIFSDKDFGQDSYYESCSANDNGYYPI